MYIAMLTKKEKEKESLGYAEPDESVQKILINLIQDLGQKKERKKERKKNREKKTHQKGKDRFTSLPSVGLTRDPPILLSLSHSSRLHQKKKAEKRQKKEITAGSDRGLKSNQKDT